MNTVKTEDGVTLAEGDRAYNYYDRWPGVIGEIDERDGWFTLTGDDGERAMLNGERICTIDYASAKGWLPKPMAYTNALLSVLKRQRQMADEAAKIADKAKVEAQRAEWAYAAHLAELKGLKIGDEYNRNGQRVRIVWFRLRHDDTLEVMVQRVTKDGHLWTNSRRQPTHPDAAVRALQEEATRV